MHLARALTTAIALILLLSVWASITAVAGSFAFPGPMTVAAAAWVIILGGGFTSAVATTLSRVVISFAIGFAIAVTAGLLMGRSVSGERFLEPFIIIGLSTPAVAVTVLMLMVLGMNTTAAVATIVFVITPLMVQTIWQGTKAVDG
jgi:NitT/TauT family transport system permease protein